MKRGAFLREQKGFTMIELMISLLVLTLAIVGYIGANIYVQRTTEEAFERSVATQDANRVIELMRNTAQTGTFPNNVVAAYPNNGLVTGFANLTNEQVRVTYVSITANPLDATVTVTWTSHTGRQENTALRTLITQR